MAGSAALFLRDASLREAVKRDFQQRNEAVRA
jgi:hypothetical protein